MTGYCEKHPWQQKIWSEDMCHEWCPLCADKGTWEKWAYRFELAKQAAFEAANQGRHGEGSCW